MTPYYSERNVTLYCGDNALVLPTLAAESIDLTVTSPPYDDLRMYNGYTFDFETVARELYRVTKPGGVVVWVVGDATVDGSETGTSFRQALYFKDCGFLLWDTMIWNKGVPTAPTESRYYAVWEFMFVLSKGKPKVLNFLEDRPNVTVGSNRQSIANIRKDKRDYTVSKQFITKDTGRRFNLWTINPYSEAIKHPAIFPEALANDHIRSWSNPGDTILDPFMGSNTTGKMARKNGCKFIGIEISEEYCRIAANRLRQEVLNFEAIA